MPRAALTEAPVLEVNGRREIRRSAYAVALAERRVRHIEELFRQSPGVWHGR